MDSSRSSNATSSTEVVNAKFPRIPRIYSSGGLALAGLFGGPLSMVYLHYRDLKALGLSDRLWVCAAWFVPLIALWLYFIFTVPPDVISQLIPFLPQTMLWWMVARHLLASVQVDHRNEGGLFRSQWAAVRFGLVIFGALKILFFAGGVARDVWLK
jgi:hypothetical protein